MLTILLHNKELYAGRTKQLKQDIKVGQKSPINSGIWLVDAYNLPSLLFGRPDISF